MIEELAKVLYDLYYDRGCDSCGRIPFGFEHETDTVRAEFLHDAEKVLEALDASSS